MTGALVLSRMSLGALLRYGAWWAFVLVLGACRARTPSPTSTTTTTTTMIDWQSPVGETPEPAALLALDPSGTAKLVCLPGRSSERQLFGGFAVGRIVDVAWNQGPVVAAIAPGPSGTEPSSAHELVLLAPHSDPRRLAKGVQSARFSPDGQALAYEVNANRNDDGSAASVTTYVLWLSTGKITEIGPLEDPFWEADGKHLRGTRQSDVGTGWQASDGRPRALRARWDRDSDSTVILGPGSSQIPAPQGSGVAWAARLRATEPPSPCIVYLTSRGGVPHTVVGRYCTEVADDRAVRWSADGQWLAFAHPGIVPGRSEAGGFCVDIVGTAGGRYPPLYTLQMRHRPEQLDIAVGPEEVWFDWSPSGRFLAMQDGAMELRVYDFVVYGIADLGKGSKPLWSPGGAYLVMLAPLPAVDADRAPAQETAPLEAFVLRGAKPEARFSLGLVREIRWLPAQACNEP